MDVIALGELLIDFACISQDEEGYPTMAAHPGGAPANFLAALNRFGMKTALLGKVGDDAFGRLLLGTLAAGGIDTRGIVTDPAVFTTLAFVTFDAGGDREFSFARKPGADTQLAAEEINFSMIDEAKVFHFGTLSLTGEPAKTATRRAVAYAKDRGKLITFDPNLRKPLWNSQEEAKAQMEWGLSQADIVKISDEEADFLWGISPEAGAEKLLAEYGVKLAFVTCGADGCVCRNRNASFSEPALSGIQVSDTTGAGDIFGGSAVAGVLKSGKAPEELEEAELRQIVRFATVAAGLSTTRPGGISSIPSFNEVMEKL